MTSMISRRGLLQLGGGTAAALSISTLASDLDPPLGASAQNGPSRNTGAEMTGPVSIDAGVQLFYRDDFLGEPWRTPEPVLLIHGVGESGIAWFGWVPRLAQEFRVLRADLPGLGQSIAPQNFQWTLSNLAAVHAHFLDALQIESAHVIGAKLGGAIAMQFAADYPRRTRTLVLPGALIAAPKFPSTTTTAKVLDAQWTRDTQRDRLGSAVSNEQIEYWNTMMSAISEPTKVGMDNVSAALDVEPILPRITCPTLVITTDRNVLQPVETVVRYQQKIAKSRLVVLQSDSYHVAVAKPDECVTNVLSFIKESRQRG